MPNRNMIVGWRIWLYLLVPVAILLFLLNWLITTAVSGVNFGSTWAILVFAGTLIVVTFIISLFLLGLFYKNFSKKRIDQGARKP